MLGASLPGRMVPASHPSHQCGGSAEPSTSPQDPVPWAPQAATQCPPAHLPSPQHVFIPSVWLCCWPEHPSSSQPSGAKPHGGQEPRPPPLPTAHLRCSRHRARLPLTSVSVRTWSVALSAWDKGCPVVPRMALPLAPDQQPAQESARPGGSRAEAGEPR